MQTQPLFLDGKLEFVGKEKYAGTTTKLSDNSDHWGQEISQEAYKRLPYLSNYEVNVVMDRVDEVRGYGFGSVEVKSRSDLSRSEQSSRPISTAHIPIIVKDNMLYPFDVFVSNNKYRYLTEGRLNEALFRPDTFDAVRDRPTEYTMGQDLVPPAMSAVGGYGLGGMKIASVPLLPLLNGRVLQEHKDRMVQAFSDPNVKVAFANAPEGVKAALLSANRLLPTDPVKTAESLWSRIRPNVVQLTKLASGRYKMKYASIEAFSPEVSEVGPDEAQSLAGPMAGQLESQGSVIASPQIPAVEPVKADGSKVVDYFGLWSVKDKGGRELVGWVFPGLLSYEGHKTDIQLFTNGSVYAMQEQIAGKAAGKSMELPDDEPRGRGCFYFKSGDQAVAYLPVTIINTTIGPDGQKKYIGERDSGAPIAFTRSDGVKVIAKMSEAEFMVPMMYHWMPLSDEVKLIEDPDMLSKTAQQDWHKIVEILGDKDVFSFRGAPLSKVAEAHTKFINRNDAEFLCAALGMGPSFVKTALDRASMGELVTTANCHTLGNLSEKMASARHAVTEELDNLSHPIRNYFLLKEASVLEDAMTADKILGLGFINAENIATFIDLLPGLEEASGNIAELLIASRLGLKDVPEAALERMMSAIEDVIKGLKTLQQKEMPSPYGVG